jgi:CheY-like chemotaxis protein
MNGFECVRRLRAKEKEKDVEGGSMRLFVIGMSANSDYETKQEVLTVGMDAFCPKPFKYKDFELIIENNHYKL